MQDGLPFYFPELLLYVNSGKEYADHVEVPNTPARGVPIQAQFFNTMGLFYYNPRDWAGSYIARVIIC